MDMSESEAWKEFVGQAVVVDTDSHLLYLGTLKEIRERFVVLSEVDVHDTRESTSTKEQYTMDSKRFGVKPNRKEASIRMELVVSLSRLEDVILYY